MSLGDNNLDHENERISLPSPTAEIRNNLYLE